LRDRLGHALAGAQLIDREGAVVRSRGPPAKAPAVLLAQEHKAPTDADERAELLGDGGEDLGKLAAHWQPPERPGKGFE
jgi:hypothetical protein